MAWGLGRGRVAEGDAFASELDGDAAVREGLDDAVQVGHAPGQLVHRRDDDGVAGPDMVLQFL